MNDISLLERYPLVVAMMDGRVQRVCSHPDDDTWSVNLKKGVASIFQNSLPSLSAVSSGLNITEVSDEGECLIICITNCKKTFPQYFILY